MVRGTPDHLSSQGEIASLSWNSHRGQGSLFERALQPPAKWS